MAENIIFHAFTRKYDCISNQLLSEATVRSGEMHINVRALWDTGATATCVSHEVVSCMKLPATGMKRIQTPSGSTTVNTYLLDVILPNNVIVQDVEVSETEIGAQNIGLLIGMDIVSKGDLSVSHFNGKTVFSFVTPSKRVIDYVQEIRIQNAIGQPHGKGKRKRK